MSRKHSKKQQAFYIESIDMMIEEGVSMKTEENTLEENPSEKKKGFFGRIFSKKNSTSEEGTKDLVKEHDEVSRLRKELDDYHSQAPVFDSFEEQINAEQKNSIAKPVFSKEDREEETLSIKPIIPNMKKDSTMNVSEVKQDNIINKDEIKQSKIISQNADSPKKNTTTPTFLNKNGMRAFEEELMNAKKALEGQKIQELWLSKGVPVKTIKQLHQCITEMNEKTFLMRQAEEEFSQWVKDHHYSEELAFNLRGTRNKEEALEEINKYFIQSIPLPLREKNKAHHDDVTSHFDKLNEDHKKAMQLLEKTVSKRNPLLLNTERIKRQFSVNTDKIIDTLTQLVYALELIDEKTYETIPIEEKEELKRWVEELANKEQSVQHQDIISIQENVIEEIRKYSNLIEQRVEKEKTHYVKESERLTSLQKQLQDEEKQLQAEWENLRLQQKQTQSDLEKQQRSLFAQRTAIEKTKENVLKTITDQQNLSENLRKELESQEEALQKQEEQAMSRKETILKEEKQLELRKKIAGDLIIKNQNDWEKEKLKQEKDLEKKGIAWEKEKERERQVIEKERLDAQELINKKLELIEQEKNAQEKLLAEKKEVQEKDFAKREAEIKAQVSSFEEQRKEYFAEQKKKEEELQAKEDAISEGIEHIDKINKNIINQKTELTKLKEDVDGDVFKRYLAQQLKNISTEHVPLKEAPLVGKVVAEQYDFYEAIRVCNQCIEAGKYGEAKTMYNALKAEYEKGMLPKKEKEILYDAIRELYANLHLAILNVGE